MITTTLTFILAYLLGSIPSGLWIGQVFFKKNLRDYGSGNTGTTNTFRILGKKAGLVVFLIDFLKGTIATLLPIWFGITGISPILFGLLAVVGHTFPIFAQFKGGKAVATSAGILFGFVPTFCFFLLVIFILTLYLTSMISMASVVAATSGIIGVFLLPWLGFLLPSRDWIFTIVVLGIALLVILRHKENIYRIRNGRENLVPWGLNLLNQKPTNQA